MSGPTFHTPESVFGLDRLADFERHVRNDPEAHEWLAANNALVLDAIDGSRACIIAVHDESGEPTFQAQTDATIGQDYEPPEFCE
jgi:hypothetical protein